MSQYVKILKWLLLITLLGLLWLNLHSVKYDYQNNISLHYIGNFKDSIVTTHQIENMVLSLIHPSDSLKKDINTILLEDLIEEDKYVKKAVVYLDVIGVLHVYIYLREPFLRIIQNSEIRYMDIEGVILPKIINVDQDLLVFTGELPPLEDLVLLVNKIYDCDMLDKLVGGISYSDEKGYILSSKICDLSIYLGKVANLNPKKKHRVNLFYNFLLNNMDCNYCAAINIEHDNQIICIK
mgnify:CR=1 FL=1|tara:strand:+ start:2292 stop:3005 length:714 start_codon:yes stop_codon:yes gene_type:complete